MYQSQIIDNQLGVTYNANMELIVGQHQHGHDCVDDTPKDVPDTASYGTTHNIAGESLMQ